MTKPNDLQKQKYYKWELNPWDLQITIFSLNQIPQKISESNQTSNHVTFWS